MGTVVKLACKYADVVFTDSTYGVLIAPNDVIIHNLVIAAPSNETLPVAIALLTQETAATFTYVYNTLKSLLGGKQPVCFVTDDDRKVRPVIAAVFPNSRLLVCMWQITQSLYRDLPKGGNQEEHQQASSCVKTLVKTCMFATTPQEALQAATTFKRSRFLQEAKYAKVKKRVDTLMARPLEWLGYARNMGVQLRVFASARVESFNEALKLRSNRRVAFITFYEHMERFMQSKRRNIINAYRQSEFSLIDLHPALSNLDKTVMPWALHALQAHFTRADHAEDENKRQTVAQNTKASSRCNCEFARTLHFPCRHRFDRLHPVPVTDVDVRWQRATLACVIGTVLNPLTDTQGFPWPNTQLKWGKVTRLGRHKLSVQNVPTSSRQAVEDERK